MASRYTKKFINARFALTAEAMGWDIGPAWEQNEQGHNRARIGVVYLDYNSMYGGWDICQIANEGGGITQVNGWCNRLSNGELIAFLDGMVKGSLAAASKGV